MGDVISFAEKQKQQREDENIKIYAAVDGLFEYIEEMIKIEATGAQTKQELYYNALVTLANKPDLTINYAVDLTHELFGRIWDAVTFEMRTRK